MTPLALLSLLTLVFSLSTWAEDQVPLSADTTLDSIPSLGFGTWNLKINPMNTSAAVTAALLAGYRNLDCAAIYGNEKEVGNGIADGLHEVVMKREEIWVTSKLWNDRYAWRCNSTSYTGADSCIAVIILTMLRLPWTRPSVI